MAAQSAQETTSLPEMFGQLQELMGSKVNDYQKSMQAAQAFTPIDPEVFKGAFDRGGAMSTAEDFASSNAWAMTPEMYKQTLQNRPDPMKQAGDLTTLSDAIFGRTASRKAMETIAGSRLDSSQKALDTAVRTTDSAKARLQNQNQFTTDMGFKEKELGFREKDAAARRGLEQQRLDIMKSEQLRMSQAEAAGLGNANNPLPLVDLGNAQKADAMARGYLGKNGKIMPGHEVNYHNARMLSHTYSTELKSGTELSIPEYKLSDGTLLSTAKFVRTPTGGLWYGVVGRDKDGRVRITENPLVVAPSASIGAGKGKAGNRQDYTVDKYQP